MVLLSLSSIAQAFECEHHIIEAIIQIDATYSRI